MDRVSNMLNCLLRSGTDFLFPVVCLNCGSDLLTNDEIDFCDRCFNELVQVAANRCELCSAVVGPHLVTESGCYFCKDDNLAFRRVTTLGTYEDQLKHAILRGKVGHDTVMLQSLTSTTIHAFRDRIDKLASDLIIPIPHHWWDRIFQSSQASNTIANHASHLLKIDCGWNVLKKIKRTAKQHSLTPTERRKNLKSTFHVPKQFHLQGLKVLLVDDVITTGTTCHRATQELLKAGAKEVNVLALGRGIGA